MLYCKTLVDIEVWYG